MSNETKTDKQGLDKLTRYPVRQLWFAENADLPGAQQASNIKVREGEQSRYYEIDWVPAWQAFHIRYFESNKYHSEQWFVAAHVKRYALLG